MKVLKGFVVSLVVAIFVTIFATTTGVWAENETTVLQEVVVLFEDGSANIDITGEIALDGAIREAPDKATVVIDGFASVKRFKGGNNALSEARALAVKDYILANKGTKILTVIARGHGVLGSESMDNARRVVVTTIQPEIRVDVIKEFATVTKTLIKIATVTEIATITVNVPVIQTVTVTNTKIVEVPVPATITYTIATSSISIERLVNIKVEDGKLYIHDSLIPQNSSPLMLTVDRNNWGRAPWKKDFFRKKGEWWSVDLSQVRSRFNAIRGGSWVNPIDAICDQGVVIHENENGSYCFVLVK